MPASTRPRAPLFKKVKTPRAMLKLGEAGLQELHQDHRPVQHQGQATSSRPAASWWNSIGGKVPEDRAALEALPGVGRKTANVVLNTAFGQPTIAVDTHIFRVANRTGIAPGKNVSGGGDSAC